jgi:hypothetical protein
MEPESSFVRRKEQNPVVGKVGREVGRDDRVVEVRLAKGSHTWIFRFQSGETRQAIGAVRSLMRRRRGLDWVDVALITHEMRLVASKPNCSHFGRDSQSNAA